MTYLSERRVWTDPIEPGRPVPPGVEPGRRFISVDFHRGIWEVVAVARYLHEPVPHARLVRVDAPHDMKSVSVEVLVDEHFYHPAEDR